MTIDRQETFQRHEGSREPRCASTSRKLEAYLAQHIADFTRAVDGRAVQGRPVEPDLQADHARPLLCAAPQAARQTACLRARGRPRISRHLGALSAGLSGRQAISLLRRREHRRHRVLRHGVRRRPHSVGRRHADADAAREERAASVRRDERDHRAVAFVRSGDRSASAPSARAKTMSRARSTAGRSNTALSETEKIDDMERLMEWLPRASAAAGAGPRSCTATTASTT